MTYLAPVLSIAATVIIFYISKKIYVKHAKAWLTPMIVTPAILIAGLLLFHIPYETYNSGGQFLTKLLGPATVAFAVPIYKNIKLLKAHALEIFVSIAVGSATAITTTFLLAVLIGLDHQMVFSLVPRSVTTPIAMDISDIIGGAPTLTAVFVMTTGILGNMVAPSIIRLCHFKSASAKGLMLGMGAHGTGTSRAFEFGELEGTFSSLAMVIAALLSIILSSTLFPILKHFAYGL